MPKALYEELANKLSRLDEERGLKLIEETLSAYINALIDSGEAIGIVTAQSVGEPSTQMILRSFHYAGLREFSMAKGLPRMIEIVDARRKPQIPMMVVYLKPPYNQSLEKAREVAAKIQEVTLESVAKSFEIDYLTYSIIIELDPERLSALGLTVKQVERELGRSRGKGVSISSEGYTIVVKVDTTDVVKLRKVRDRLMQFHISGLKGVKKTMVLRDQQTGEWYIITEGVNLEGVLMMEEVDHTRTYTNDLHRVYEVLGVEAVRNLIAQEMKRVLDDQGLDVDIRHLQIVADVMTLTGRLRQIGRHGVAGRKESPLARAAFEVTVKNLVQAAVKGERETFRGVFENIIAGRHPRIGTGMVRLFQELR